MTKYGEEAGARADLPLTMNCVPGAEQAEVGERVAFGVIASEGGEDLEIRRTVWEWSDGSVAQVVDGPAAAHGFSSPGVFTVEVSATAAGATEGGGGSRSVQCPPVTITEPEEAADLDAEIAASSDRVKVGEEIAFTDVSLGNPDAREWTFGPTARPNSAPGREVTVAFDVEGIVTVTLEVSRSSDDTSDTETLDIVVVDDEALDGRCGIRQPKPESGGTATFAYEPISGTPTTYEWTITAPNGTVTNPTGGPEVKVPVPTPGPWLASVRVSDVIGDVRDIECGRFDISDGSITEIVAASVQISPVSTAFTDVDCLALDSIPAQVSGSLTFTGPLRGQGTYHLTLLAGTGELFADSVTFNLGAPTLHFGPIEVLVPLPPEGAGLVELTANLTPSSPKFATRTAAATVFCDLDQPDQDRDGVVDSLDNCPSTPNPGDGSGNQPDSDGDGRGDACDPDVDGDGVDDNPGPDNCPGIPNPVEGGSQPDADGDGLGDPCDDSDDGDSIPDDIDTCPNLNHEDNTDTDGDGRGDVCDPDDDDDGIPDDGGGNAPSDNCPLVPNGDQTDTDGDGDGDACDGDSDGDGIPDEADGTSPADNCRLVVNPAQIDTDGDGEGDECDDDDDGDTIPDASDQCPGFDDLLNSDGDALPDCLDNCPNDDNPGQGDFDLDLIGDVCDLDVDGDGTDDNPGPDNCPLLWNDQSNVDGDAYGDACEPFTSRSGVILPQTWNLDLNSGLTASPGNLRFHASGGVQDLRPASGSTMTLAPGSNGSLQSCFGLSYSSSPVTAGSLPPGAVLCVRLADGRHVAITVQARPGSSTSGSASVDQTWGFDLENGITPGTGGGDMWFQAETATVRWWTPRNGARFKVTDCTGSAGTGSPWTTYTSSNIPISSLTAGVSVCGLTRNNYLTRASITAAAGPSPGTLEFSYITWPTFVLSYHLETS